MHPPPAAARAAGDRCPRRRGPAEMRNREMRTHLWQQHAQQAVEEVDAPGGGDGREHKALHVHGVLVVAAVEEEVQEDGGGGAGLGVEQEPARRAGVDGFGDGGVWGGVWCVWGRASACTCFGGCWRRGVGASGWVVAVGREALCRWREGFNLRAASKFSSLPTTWSHTLIHACMHAVVHSSGDTFISSCIRAYMQSPPVDAVLHQLPGHHTCRRQEERRRRRQRGEQRRPERIGHQRQPQQRHHPPAGSTFRQQAVARAHVLGHRG